MKVFSNLNEIMLLCPVEEIKGEIKDSEAIIAKIIEAKRKNDSFFKENTSEGPYRMIASQRTHQWIDHDCQN